MIKHKKKMLYVITVFLVITFITPNIIATQQAVDQWPMFRFNQQRSGWATHWSAHFNTVMWIFPAEAMVYSSPAVVDDRVYFGTSDGKVWCLDATDSTTIWAYTAGGDVVSSPAVVNNKVFVGSMDGVFHCLNTSDGTLIWSYSTGSEIISSPVVANGKVYFATTNGTVYCLNEGDGALIWNRTLSSGVESSPAYFADKIYIGSNDSLVYCLNATDGNQIWNYTTSGSVRSTPAVAVGNIYVGSQDGGLYCINATDGSLNWIYNTSDEVLSSPSIFWDIVVFGSNDSNIYGVDANNGSLVWNYTTGGAVWASPSVSEDRVFVGSNDGWMYCLNAFNGSVMWMYNVSSEVSSVAIADGRIYFGSLNTRVYCIGSDWETPIIWDVTHSPEVPTNMDNVTVTAHVNDTAGIFGVKLSYFNGTNTTTILMTEVATDVYQAVIPAYPTGTRINYTIEALDNTGTYFMRGNYEYTVQGAAGEGTDFSLNASESIGVVAIINSTEPVKVNITPAELDPTVPPKFTVADKTFEIIGQAFEINANVTSGFNITITYHYNQSLIDELGINENQLALFYFNETSNQWEEVPTTVDTVNNVLTGYVDHLTVFAAFGQQEATLFINDTILFIGIIGGVIAVVAIVIFVVKRRNTI
ncbi:MAG: beta-alanine-activating enzyme beta-propeller domain-containing protein [Candidatus Odinarchaeia archaeon]